MCDHDQILWLTVIHNGRSNTLFLFPQDSYNKNKCGDDGFQLKVQLLL